MKKKMTLLEEAEERKEINKRQNREFIDMYVEWIKKTSNHEWSEQQKKLIDSMIPKKKK